MKELIEWYWEHGKNRGKDTEQDPDSALRKISIGSWLDPIVRILDRDNAIRNNINQKACLALWGPSQSGKSTLLSRYIDGDKRDGSDSALTWDPNKKTRFSPPKDGVEALRKESPDTMIFNPYNHQSDASGVATRYQLKKSSDGVVNPKFPVEIKFTSRSQIIQSLALGYLSECHAVDEQHIYTQQEFHDAISKFDDIGEPQQEAYKLLNDVARVIEQMRGVQRFSNLFKRDEWDKSLRRELVSAPALLANVEKVERFMFELFWDSAVPLTNAYHDIITLLNRLENEWRGCHVFATLEVASILLDISSYSHYINPQGSEGAEMHEKISCLGYERQGNEIYLSIGKPNNIISGDQFGCFQAVCAELVVPFRQESIEANPEKKTFIDLTSKCDLLDFPGVSKKDTGPNADETTPLLDPQQVTKKDIFTKVFKHGKTQCFVYHYARQYGIDAFVMLVRTADWPAKSSLLNAGINDWIHSYDPTWMAGKPTCLPVFLNMTFFSSLINSVSQSGIGAGLRPYADRILGELQFARKKSVRFFATTYPQFPGQGDIAEEFHNIKDSTIEKILNDCSFSESFDITQENLKAVYDKDGGVDYMLSNITDAIDMSRRKLICAQLLTKDKEELLRMLKEQLPPNEDMELVERKQQLQSCIEDISNIISQIELNMNPDDYIELSCELKQLFSSSATQFDPIPNNFSTIGGREGELFIKTQMGKWFESKVQSLQETKFLSLKNQQIILAALRDAVPIGKLQMMLRDRFGDIPDRTIGEAARFPFSLALSNFFQFGAYLVDSHEQVGDCEPLQLEKFIHAEQNQDTNRNGSPYHYSILQPLCNRLQALVNDTTTFSHRPPQDGDMELATLVESLENSNEF